jgi:uncharacterized protein YqgV (UPF0045/DUF77 family)
MKTTIEISLYPLREAFIPEIDDFIARVQAAPGLTVRVNETSTHISGDYDQVMAVVQNEIKTTFGHEGKFVFAMKVLKGDLLN